VSDLLTQVCTVRFKMRLALLLALVLHGAPATHSFALSGDTNAPAALVEVDPASGEALPGSEVRLGDSTDDAAVLGPDGRTAAFGGSKDEVLLVDLASRRRLASLRVARGDRDGYVHAIGWPTPRRLVVTTGQGPSKWWFPETLRVVDPVRGRVSESLPFGRRIADAVGPAGSALVLCAPPDGVGALRLVRVDRRGVRSVTLPQVTGGATSSVDAFPGFAVDRAGRRAFVLAPDVSAEVDLDTLAVQWRPGVGIATAAAWPARETGSQNPFNGFSRDARWLGDGRVAVSGVDMAITQDFKQVDTPAGLRIVNTREWSIRTAEPDVSRFEVVGPRLLAAPARWEASRRRYTGAKLAAYSLDGRPLYRRLDYRSRTRPDTWQVFGDHVAIDGTLRDPATGRALGRVPEYDYLPWTLFTWHG